GQRVRLNDLELAAELLLQLGQGRDAAPVALHGDDRRSGVEQCPGEAARARAHLLDALAFERTGDRCDPRQELPVEDEILSARLARAEAMASDDRAQRLGRAAQAPSVRSAAQPAAIRIAAAMGRASARSWPAMSNAVP